MNSRVAHEGVSFALRRVGVVMTPEDGNPAEVWGVLNPASARTPDGQLYIFPRLVAEGNYSRIGVCRVRFDEAGDPRAVERLGYALEPEEPYERAERTHGGVEDPRITYIPALSSYVMAYTALGRLGPRIALATSRDLCAWTRLGLLSFELDSSVDFNRFGNKDCVLFPEPVTDPEGQQAFALLHRPTYLLHNPDGTIELVLPEGVNDQRPSIWISYVPIEPACKDIGQLVRVNHSRLLAAPVEPWEALKVGAGTPPILTTQGWLVYYHGVEGTESIRPEQAKNVRYQAGAMLLDRDDPRKVVQRSPRPVLQPQEASEREGIVANVVFPTAVDVRGERIDVYYGAADTRIAVATTTLDFRILLAPSAAPGSK